jgi:hypothetical protein
MRENKRRPDAVGQFMGTAIPGMIEKRFPGWRYHKILDPILVNNTGEEDAARLKGYDDPGHCVMANKQLINWFWDIEDMSTRQLVVYAQEEYGVELPIEAGQTELAKAVFELGRWAPQNRDRIVLMAHTLKMNLDETIEEIKRMAAGPPGTETEVIKEEFWA